MGLPPSGLARGRSVHVSQALRPIIVIPSYPIGTAAEEELLGELRRDLSASGSVCAKQGFLCLDKDLFGLWWK
jgi:hypothetical protein